MFKGLNKNELELIVNEELTKEIIETADGSIQKVQHILSEENAKQYTLLNELRKEIGKKNKINALVKLTEIDFKNHNIEYLQQLLLKDNNFRGVHLIEQAKNKIKQNANEDIVKTMLGIELCN